MKTNLILVPAISLFFIACTKETIEPVTTPTQSAKTEMKISFSAQQATKVMDEKFEINDEVGVFITNQGNTLAVSNNYEDNVKHTYNSSLSWTSAKTLYWDNDETKYDFYAYYPYSSNASTSYSFTVKEDQSQLTDYKGSELLWGVSKAVSPIEKDGSVTIPMKHSMSCAVIKVTLGNGFSSTTTASVKLKDINTTTILNLSDGKTSTNSNQKDVIPLTTEENEFTALIPAQTISDGTPLLGITVDNKEYILRSGCTFEQGKKHIVTVNVSKQSSGMNINISKWENGGEISGNAE
jgi:endonuclease G